MSEVEDVRSTSVEELIKSIQSNIQDHFGMHTVHTAVHTQSTLQYTHSPYCSIHTIHIAVYTQSTLQYTHSPHCGIHTVHTAVCTQSTLQYTHNPHCGIHTVDTAVYTQSTLQYTHNSHCGIHTVHTAVYTQSTLHYTHSPHCSTLHTLQFSIIVIRHTAHNSVSMACFSQVSYLEGMVLEHLLDKNQCIKFGDGLDDLLHFFICHFYQLTIVLLTWQWTHPSFGHPRVLLQQTDCG